MTSMSNDAVRTITPDQELCVLKLILSLRNLCDIEASEKLRTSVRKALLRSESDHDASIEVEGAVRRARKVESKLDGSYDRARERKRLKREEERARAYRYVDAEAESGDDSEGTDEEQEVVS
ncbi:unnamed protein product [Phytomonas sp. Hart1]|nr:unnamed protein product [Phytomonas sp. Hart1]|eukprot:CCW68248.1 unnamed protein product [Phytomonas sp. isolate Hart1]